MKMSISLIKFHRFTLQSSFYILRKKFSDSTVISLNNSKQSQTLYYYKLFQANHTKRNDIVIKDSLKDLKKLKNSNLVIITYKFIIE